MAFKPYNPLSAVLQPMAVDSCLELFGDFWNGIPQSIVNLTL
jgi:hypothetical protein